MEDGLKFHRYDNNWNKIRRAFLIEKDIPEKISARELRGNENVHLKHSMSKSYNQKCPQNPIK